MNLNENNIFIYKILNNSIELINKLEVADLIDIKILNDSLFALKFGKGMNIYSLDTPYLPTKINTKDFKHYILSVEKYKNYIIVYSEKGILHKFELVNNNLLEKCLLNFNKEVNLSGKLKNQYLL